MRMEKPPVHGTTTGDCKPLTTFVHTNTDGFRDVVQRLTGPSEVTVTKEDQTTKAPPPPMKRTTPPRLHERRKCMKPKLEIVKPSYQYYKPGSASPSSKSRNSSIPSSPISGSGSSSLLPSPTTPSTLFSKLTIMEDERKQESTEINIEEEEKAIKERRFYLHPSPRPKAGGTGEPELLILFPLASPKASEQV